MMKKATKAAASKSPATMTVAQKDVRNAAARAKRATLKAAPVDGPDVAAALVSPLVDTILAAQSNELFSVGENGQKHDAAIWADALADDAPTDPAPAPVAVEAVSAPAPVQVPKAAKTPIIWQHRSGGRPPLVVPSVLKHPAPGTATAIGTMVADYLKTHAVDPFRRPATITWMVEHAALAYHVAGIELAQTDGQAVTS